MKFPESVVEAAIREEIAVAARDRPPSMSGWRPEVDSPVVICVILRVEAEIGIELPVGAVPPGGFDDVEACVQGILAQSRRIWREMQQQKGETVS
ncbi:MAG: hypothetical protein OXH76_01895 [Boseongicola sp.]|nr:hypothetical protein [Boseongicola sp.]